MELGIAAALKAPGEVFHARLSEEFPAQTYAGREIRFLAPLTLDISYSFDGKAFALTGELETVLASACARCAEPFAEPFHAHVEERFVKGDRMDDDDSYSFEGDTLPLSSMVLDNLFLRLPITSVCREDCQGLCPNCGCNLNTTQCDCAPEEPQGPFSALSRLRNIGKEV